MKIEYKDGELKKYEDIEEGTVFKRQNENSIFMKTNRDSFIDLESGFLEDSDESEEVIVVQAKLVVFANKYS